jgi:putative oxidoreductase
MLVRLHNATFHVIQRLFEDWLIGTLGRLVFAGVLLVYFINSAMTKFRGAFPEVTVGAYAQILPKRMEAAGFDPSQLDTIEHVIVYAGSYAEIILPVLIVVGLFTRLASIGMIGFIAVMTYVDITAHQVDAATIGAWFDNTATASIADQRSLWAFLLIVLVLKGPGPISLDALLGRFWVRR